MAGSSLPRGLATDEGMLELDEVQGAELDALSSVLKYTYATVQIFIMTMHNLFPFFTMMTSIHFPLPCTVHNGAWVVL